MSTQYCTFHLADLYMGVEVRHVQEVLRYQRMRRVPLASEIVEGLINLRGQIVTAIDLRRRVGLPERPADCEPTNVIVRDADGVVSLLVDEIGDVLDVDEDRVEEPPSTIPGPAGELIRGVYKLESQLLLLLDVEQMFRIEAGEAVVGGEAQGHT
ncbi:MAG: chemotaxis protein CheW [Planctomycetota bacterium]